MSLFSPLPAWSLQKACLAFGPSVIIYIYDTSLLSEDVEGGCVCLLVLLFIYQLGRGPAIKREEQLPKPLFRAMSLTEVIFLRWAKPLFTSTRWPGPSLCPCPSSLWLPFLLPSDPSPHSLCPHQSLVMTYKNEAFILWNFPSGCLPGTLVQSLVKNLEKQLEAPVKKPSGGVSLFLLPNTGPQRAAMPGNKPQVGHRTLGGCLAISNRANSKCWGTGVGCSVSLGPSGTLPVTSLSLLPLHRGRNGHFLFVSLLMLRSLLVHYTRNCSTDRFSWSLMLLCPASDRAGTWFCARMLAVATVFWLSFIPSWAPPPSFSQLWTPTPGCVCRGDFSLRAGCWRGIP